MIFIDSNVVIDLLQRVGEWPIWSRSVVARLSRRNRLATSTVVLAETAGRFDTMDAQLTFFDGLGAELHQLDAAAAHRAGLAHRAYRRAGGPRAGILADFLIGGHAAALGATLLTRDRQRFASYFPELTLITPETHP